MSGRISKLLRKFCKVHKRPLRLYADRYAMLPKEGKKAVNEYMRKSLSEEPIMEPPFPTT
jgi:hypothetical protein